MDSRHFESRRGKAVHRRVKVFIVDFNGFIVYHSRYGCPADGSFRLGTGLILFVILQCLWGVSLRKKGGGHKVACYSRDFSNLTVTFPLVLLSFKILKRFPT